MAMTIDGLWGTTAAFKKTGDPDAAARIKRGEATPPQIVSIYDPFAIAAARKAPVTSRTTSTRSTAPTAAQLAAQREAAARAAAYKAANNSARLSANSDLERLNSQITANLARKATNDANLTALKDLVGGGHAKVRDNALAALDASLTAKLAQIKDTFLTSFGDFQVNQRDNESAVNDASFGNLVNRAREKQDVVQQALSQGAGESDVLKSQLQALRNWASNQSDVNRSYFDTRTSINAGITDLNNTTKTGMMNEEMSTNAARASRWDDFYESMGSAYSDMANLDQQNYLLQAEIDATERAKGTTTGLLAWLDAGKNAEDYQAPKLTNTGALKPPAYTSDYAKKAAEMAGSYWADPGVSDETKAWKGGAQSQFGLNNTQVQGSQLNEQQGAPRRKRPEGATLRRW